MTCVRKHKRAFVSLTLIKYFLKVNPLRFGKTYQSFGRFALHIAIYKARPIAGPLISETAIAVQLVSLQLEQPNKRVPYTLMIFARSWLMFI
jgi:hypothetical protein